MGGKELILRVEGRSGDLPKAGKEAAGEGTEPLGKVLPPPALAPWPFEEEEAEAAEGAYPNAKLRGLGREAAPKGRAEGGCWVSGCAIVMEGSVGGRYCGTRVASDGVSSRGSDPT